MQRSSRRALLSDASLCSTLSHTSAYVRMLVAEGLIQKCVGVRNYVSIRQNTSAYVSILQKCGIVTFSMSHTHTHTQLTATPSVQCDVFFWVERKLEDVAEHAFLPKRHPRKLAPT